jgi:hypothetical protein
VLHADGEVFELRPGMMARVGPGQLRRIVPGGDGIRFNRARHQHEEGGPFAAYGVMVFAIEDNRIAGIVGFPDVHRPDLFERLGLPGELAA